ncbi:MAG: hypothetical protein CMM44_09745 [Rhodospirillaceae bacterium]|nr:hypothetical protein [Rhodospirillaceae bacterium]
MIMTFGNKIVLLYVFFALFICLSGCVSNTNINDPLTPKFDPKPANAHQRLALEGVEFLREGEYAEANGAFNRALRMQPQNSAIQFFNAYTYHQRALTKDASFFDLAEAGYRASIKFDDSNWISRFYLGKLFLDQRKFILAQKVYATLLLQRNSDPDVAYNLAVSSYFSADPITAAAATHRLRQLQPDEARTHELAAVVYAAVNDKESSLRHYDAIETSSRKKEIWQRYKDWTSLYEFWKKRDIENQLNKKRTVTVRTGDTVYKISKTAKANLNDVINLNKLSAPYHIRPGQKLLLPGHFQVSSMNNNMGQKTIKTYRKESVFKTQFKKTKLIKKERNFYAVQSAVDQSNSVEGETNSVSDANAVSDETNPNPPEDSGISTQSGVNQNSSGRKMVLVDVVIINSVEDISTSSGINLLKNLQLTFGSADSVAFSDITTQSDDLRDSSSSTKTRAIVKALSIPAITYSLNIANSGSDRNDILARPTIVATEGETSEFFSGENIRASSVSTTAQSGAVDIEQDIGVNLKVTPERVADGKVKLKVEVERTFLLVPSNNVTFSFQLRTMKTKVNATVDLSEGDTLILSGLSEKQVENLRDGVPILQDIPGVQYLFSNLRTRDYHKSVILLITPRFPEYTYTNSKNKDKNNGEASLQEGSAIGRNYKGLSELRARHTDWFKPYPNWASIFMHLQGNALYREFRTGDVSLESWNTQADPASRLKKAIEMLYY